MLRKRDKQLLMQTANAPLRGMYTHPFYEKPPMPILVRATQAIANGGSGTVEMCEGSDPLGLQGHGDDSSFVIYNPFGSDIAMNDEFAVIQCLLPNSTVACWIPINVSAQSGDRIFTGTAETDIIFDGHGLITSDEEGSGVRVWLRRAHGDESISAGKEIIYSKRVDGTRLVIAADCETEDPAAGIPTGVTAISPTEGASGQASAGITLSWTATSADDYDVYLGEVGSVTQVATAQAGTTYATGTLGLNNTFHWYIVANNTNGSQQSTVYQFSTQGGVPIGNTSTSFTTAFDQEAFE